MLVPIIWRRLEGLPLGPWDCRQPSVPQLLGVRFRTWGRTLSVSLLELGASRFSAVQPVPLQVGLPPSLGMLAQAVAVHWRARAGAAQSTHVIADVLRIPLGQNTLRDGPAAEHGTIGP